LPFYEWVPFLNYIQCPWRLLSILTPLSVILFFYYIPVLINIFFKKDPNLITRIFILSVLFLQIFWVGGNSQLYRYQNYPDRELNQNMATDNLIFFSFWDEYEPIPFKRKNVLSLLENKGCKIVFISDPGYLNKLREFDKIVLRLEKGFNGQIIFNQIMSPFISWKCSSNITVRKGEYQEMVFEQKNDEHEAFIEITKTGLFGLIRRINPAERILRKH
jgi:hypothetical protein